jgi:hypothetical protein
MRIRVEDEHARLRLVGALVEAGCSARALDDTLEIVESETQDAPTPLELRFFLRAWQRRHPDVQLYVVA